MQITKGFKYRLTA